MTSEREIKQAEALRNAKTGQEMLDSWQTLVGDGNIDDIKQVFQVYADKMPELLSFYTQQPLAASVERGTLDPKTRELVLVGMLAAMQCGPGVVFHIQGAIHEGASEEEIMEVIFLSSYQHGKVQAASLGQSVEEGLKRAANMKEIN
jgi:AhpD family alkylhydroperoxidase